MAARAELIGREAELSAVDELLLADRAGTLLIEGEAGIGKTTLWREGVRRAEANGYIVLSCRPAEAEAKLSFAALADILEPVADAELGVLPAPQRDALEIALLRGAAGGRQAVAAPRAVGAGLRNILVSLSRTVPLLVAMDDVQWLDAASASALGFALRRVEGERVVLLATRRRGGRAHERLALACGSTIRLDRLSLAAIHELLKQRLGRSLPRPLLLRLFEASGGNPFYALEIGRELLESGTPVGNALPVPADVRRLVARRLGRLSPETRETLLVAAAVAGPSRGLISLATGADRSRELEEAERAEVLELTGDEVRFAHPLYAAAIYSAAPLRRRRDVHRALSEVVTEPEERARHLALATDAPSAKLAAMLDEAAASAHRRGAPGVAAELSELALERTTPEDDEARQDRAVDVVERLLVAADAQRAAAAARAALPTLRSASRRVRVLLALSELAMWSSQPLWEGHGDSPVSLAERALVEAGDDPSLQARAHVAIAGCQESDSEAAYGHALRGLELIAAGAEVSPAVHAEGLSISARCRLFQGEGLDTQSMRRAIELERGQPPRLVHDTSSFRLGQWLKYVDEFAESRTLLERSRRQAEDEGDNLSLVNILINLVILSCWSGDWGDARALGAELVQRFLELGWTDAPTPHIALEAALRGDAELVAQLESIPAWTGVYEVIRLRPLGMLALSEGRVEAAWAYFRRALALLDEAQVHEPAIFRIHADAVEAAVLAGDVDPATALTAALSSHAERSPIPWNRAMALRCAALVAAAQGALDEALIAAEAAVPLHDRLPMPFERARTLLVKGRIERRARQRGVAKATLEQALAELERLGARIWAEQARGELRRVGLRRAPDELTANERRVAELAASGRTNREVAAELFMSPKTVEANLARAYRKLGVRSRAELGALLSGSSASRAAR